MLDCIILALSLINPTHVHVQTNYFPHHIPISAHEEATKLQLISQFHVVKFFHCCKFQSTMCTVHGKPYFSLSIAAVATHDTPGGHIFLQKAVQVAKTSKVKYAGQERFVLLLFFR